MVVARTFSKAFGMAGLRIGYAIGHRDSIAKLRAWDADGAVNVLGLSAARAALTQDPNVLKNEKQAQHRGACVHAEVVQGSRLHADRFADQLPVRGHQASGARLP